MTGSPLTHSSDDEGAPMGETDTATIRVLGEPLRLGAVGLNPAGLPALLPARERRAA